MDAILGRDEKLVQNLADTASFMRACDQADAPGFAAIIARVAFHASSLAISGARNRS
jgi:hypothetical protein